MRYTARAPLRIDFAGGWTDAPIYAAEHGGAVLNAAITQYARGSIARADADHLSAFLPAQRSRLAYTLDLPAESGLGASAAQTVLWVALVKSVAANVSDRLEIAEIACQVAGLLGILDGRQDEYASALGGISYFTFGASVEAHRLQLDTPLREELRSRLLLVYSGRGQPSGPLREQVWSRYQEGDATVRRALARLGRLAGDMKNALLARDLDAFADFMTENWEQQKKLHPSITSPRMDAILDLARRDGARGGKACGAGGGGYLLLMAGAGQEHRLRRALQRQRLPVVDVDFDWYGVYLRKG